MELYFYKGQNMAQTSPVLDSVGEVAANTRMRWAAVRGEAGSSTNSGSGKRGPDGLDLEGSAMARRGGRDVLGFVSGARSMVNARPGAA